MNVRRWALALLVLAIVLLVGAALALRASNTVAGTPLQLATASPNPGGICPGALLLPVTVGHADGRLVFRNGLGEEVSLVWPNGYAARLVNGTGELLDPSGSIVARDGDTLSGMGGGGDPFIICSPS